MSFYSQNYFTHFEVRDMTSESYESWKLSQNLDELFEKYKAMDVTAKMEMICNFSVTDVLKLMDCVDLKWRIKPDSTQVKYHSIAAYMKRIFLRMIRLIARGAVDFPIDTRLLTVKERQLHIGKRQHTFAIDVLKPTGNSDGAETERITVCIVAFDVQKCEVKKKQANSSPVGIQIAGYAVSNDCTIGEMLEIAGIKKQFLLKSYILSKTRRIRDSIHEMEKDEISVDDAKNGIAQIHEYLSELEKEIDSLT